MRFLKHPCSNLQSQCKKKCSASHQITNELHEVKERKKCFLCWRASLQDQMKSENFECRAVRRKTNPYYTHIYSNVVLDRVLIVISLDKISTNLDWIKLNLHFPLCNVYDIYTWRIPCFSYDLMRKWVFCHIFFLHLFFLSLHLFEYWIPYSNCLLYSKFILSKII